MHAMTDLDCEKYRHPDTARARRRDTYADHGVSEDERGDLAHHLTRWLPYLHSVVEASRRLRGRRGADDRRRRLAGRAHARPLARPRLPVVARATGVLLSGDHLLPGITPPVTFERGFDADPLRSYLDVAARPSPTCAHGTVLPGHGAPVRRPAGRIEAILPHQGAAAGEDPPGHRGEQPSLGRRARRPARRQGDPRPPAPARDQRDARAHRLPALVRRASSGAPGRTASTSGTPRRTRPWTSPRSPPTDRNAPRPQRPRPATQRGRADEVGPAAGRAGVSAPARPHPWSGCGGTRRAAPAPRWGCRGRSCGSGRSPA